MNYNNLIARNRSQAEQYAVREGLEVVFPEGHTFNNVIFYDRTEGKYYNRTTDLYLQETELKCFGLLK